MVGPLQLRSRVGPKGQTVIPKPVRDLAGIRPGDEVTFRVEGRQIILSKKSGLEILEELFSAIPKRKAPKHIDWDKEWYSQYG